MTSSTLLSDIAFVVDCEHKTAPVADLGSEFAYSIGTPALRGADIDFTQAKRVSRETYEAWSRRAELRNGDIILAREAPIGGVGFVDGRMRVCLGQRTVLVRVDATKADPKYVFYLLRSDGPQKWMEMHSEGSTVKHLNVADVRKIDLGVLPTLEEQQRIANVLSVIDQQIQVDKQIMGQILELSRSNLSRVTDENTERVRLDSLAEINPAKAKKAQQSAITYLAIADVQDGSITWPESVSWDEAPAAARLLTQKGDIIWSRVRPNRRSHAILPERQLPIIVSTGMVVLRAKRVSPSYLMAVCDSAAFSDRLTAITGGTAYPTVDAEDFASIEVPLITESALTDFESLMGPLWEAFLQLDDEVADLEQTRDTLLPLLIEGTTKVRGDLR